MAADPGRWLLTFSANDPDAPNGDGRPWGDGTEMAARSYVGRPPWDLGCAITTYVGGRAAMDAMRVALKQVIDSASSTPMFDRGSWARGHVYIADWRFNCLRDMSTGTDRWTSQTTDDDATAIGLVMRMMQAGVQVRLLLWYPLTIGRAAGFAPQIEDHLFAAGIVEQENQRLMGAFGATPDAEPLGVVALDLRIAEARVAGSHHQKMMVIRTPGLNVAFAGGVDLAFTRRDAPPLLGDWQSGPNIPPAGTVWPQQDGVDYQSLGKVTPANASQKSDLPLQVFGNRQAWHDQHLRLTGPIVATLESQFAERWRDSGAVFDLSKLSHWTQGQVILSSPGAIQEGAVRPLPIVPPEPTGGGNSIVQMWRTIPWRDGRTAPPFRRGEFTVMAGIARAISAAQELIWIFDQYFWSRPLARSLHRRLKAHPPLRVILVLPPHADDHADQAHRARAEAVAELIGSGPDSTASQVAVYAMWDSSIKTPPPPANPPIETTSHGIYVHAKVQMYDGSLLVCGSANLNRRSFTCDSELALAVLDSTVVAAHQQALWEHLFPTTAWPGLDLDAPGNGASFFDAFRAAAGLAKAGEVGPSRLIIDPWDADASRLPNGALRERSGTGPAFDWWYDFFLDPSSISTASECDSRDPATGNLRAAGLDDIVVRLERVYHVRGDGTVIWPYRKQHW
jgi:phosphatidylserine/phosphatidylglycerophosphate/cardiolipin synthase-like enzyme